MTLLPYIYKFFEYYIKTNVPEVKSIDLFFNQFETQELGETDSRDNPRVLIEISECEPMQMFNGIQNLVFNVNLHIGIDIINLFASDSDLQSTNLAYLELLDNIYHKLQGITSYDLPDELKEEYILIYQVERSKILLATNENSIKVSQISFRMIIEDNTLMKEPIEDNTIDFEMVIAV